MIKSEGFTGELNVRFEQADGYRLVPATGVWGGMSPNGEIVVDFFVEQREIPDQLVLRIENGEKKDEKRTGREGFVRVAQFGVVMRPDIANSVGEFLIAKAKEVGFPSNTGK